jgi:tetratricopeptide (TPR) repeat protein
VYHHLGEHERAVACLEQSLVLFQQLGDRYHSAETLTHLGDAHSACGRAEAATEAWQAALMILLDLGHSDAEAVHLRLTAAAPAPT